MHRRGTVTACCNLVGLCHCGCGSSAPICTRTNSNRNERKGEYHQYINGHNAKRDIVANHRIIPMYQYLKTVYGTWTRVAEAVGIPLSTLEGQIYSRKHISIETATKVTRMYNQLKGVARSREST